IWDFVFTKTNSSRSTDTTFCRLAPAPRSLDLARGARFAQLELSFVGKWGELTVGAHFAKYAHASESPSPAYPLAHLPRPGQSNPPGHAQLVTQGTRTEGFRRGSTPALASARDQPILARTGSARIADRPPERALGAL